MQKQKLAKEQILETITPVILTALDAVIAAILPLFPREYPNSSTSTPTPGEPEFLIVPEVARLLRVTERTIYQLIADDRLPHRRANDRILFDRAEVVEWTATEAKRARDQKKQVLK